MTSSLFRFFELFNVAIFDFYFTRKIQNTLQFYVALARKKFAVQNNHKKYFYYFYTHNALTILLLFYTL